MDWRAAMGALLLAASAAAQADNWPCYDPQPGHPTIAERRAFVDDIARHALAAEARHGVPAPAIAAMAIQESGYGFTRTALNANNLFGFKWASAAGAGGRPAWVLTCQPAADVNNRYIRFSNRADAIDFVAGRLAQSDHYRADTEAFKAAMARGDDRSAAVLAWVDGIADPYNADSTTYRRSIRRLLNNALAPSDTLSPTDNLYRLAPKPTPTPTPTPASAPAPTATPTPTPAPAPAPAPTTTEQQMRGKVEALYQRSIDAHGRYMEHDCKDVAPSDPALAAVIAPYSALAAKGVRIVDCRYPFAQRSARVIMANVDAPQLARWTLSACTDNKVGDLNRCLAVTSHNIWCGSNAQFAIAGAVVEEAKNCRAQPGPQALIPFRDGVTVRIAGDAAPYCSTQPYSPQQELASITGKVGAVKKIGRVAMVTREMYRQAGGKVDVSATAPDASGKNPWLDVVREGYVDAVGQDAYPLLAAWVKYNRARFDRYKSLDLERFNCGAYYGTK